ncbi:TlpA family protein disulfide reductase [Intestinibacter bartlettii]|uniref:TlpA family protein disulfide reductase n=1 Tax=Intestinibacter bartlettii TaxID=261299 RepID=A0ABS6DUB1_9FIRM|nr:TlpA disulfide reductase family protein [Intestinibacter bartlettii]MBU5335422.1 TlpA family protein disulfide reductase [Intestinibacter bartlettii]MDO5011011.1 TlpA disulfide reductase family protein [Intestinibacter bartlettii]
MKRGKITKKVVLALVAMMAMSSLVGCSKSNGGASNGANQSQSQEINKNLSESKLFKNLDTEDLDGNKIDKSIFAKNKLTMVNVWNTGCTPCVEEIPVLDKLNKEYRDKRVSIKGLLLESRVGLNEEERKTVNEILSKANATYQQILTSQSMLDDDTLLLQAFPTTFFVDKDGNIVDSIEGSNDYDGWKAKIEEVLKKVESND